MPGAFARATQAGATVLGSEGELQQVMTNLMLNAIDAMGDGGGQLMVRTHRIMKPGATVWTQIEIEDSGPGISKANLEHIFDPFRQEDSSTTRSQGGLGLGLAISREIAETMGGTLSLESEPGLGSRFELEVEMPGGRRWFCEASGAPVRNAEGQVIGGIAVTVDVTDRRRIEAADPLPQLVRAGKRLLHGDLLVEREAD